MLRVFARVLFLLFGLATATVSPTFTTSLSAATPIAWPELVCDCGTVWAVELYDATWRTFTAFRTPVKLINIAGGPNANESFPARMADINLADPTRPSVVLDKLCADDLRCRGYFVFTLPDFDPEDPNGAVWAQFYTYDTSVTATPQTDFRNTTGLHVPGGHGGDGETDSWQWRKSLMRYERYRCPAIGADANPLSSAVDFPFDTLHPFYFYFHSGARADIEAMFCPHVNLIGECCWAVDADQNCLPDPFDSAGVNKSAVLAQDTSNRYAEAAIAYWQMRGHYQRYPPNGNCNLLPTLYASADDIDYSSDAGCTATPDGCYLGADAYPCGDDATGNPSFRGYCTRNYDGGLYGSNAAERNYFCDCLNYTSGEAYPGAAKYGGNACQYNSTAFCVNPNLDDNPDALMCGNTDTNTRCMPHLLGTSPENYDFACNCTPSASDKFPGSGTYCDITVCDPDNNCQIRSAGTCNGYTGQCVCEQYNTPITDANPYNGATGNLCQYAVSRCIDHTLSNSTAKVCSGQDKGVCMPPDADNGIYGSDPNYASGREWCRCLHNNTGAYCATSACPTGTSPLRAICHAGGAVQCRGGYSGKPACATDYCASSGGILMCQDPEHPTDPAIACNDPANAAGVPVYCACGLKDQSDDGFFCVNSCPKYNGIECGVTHANPDFPACVKGNTGSANNTAYCSCDTNSEIPVKDTSVVINDVTILSTTFAADGANASINYGNGAFLAPDGVDLHVCTPYCKHGAPYFPSVWDNSDPTTWTYCNCPASSGYWVGAAVVDDDPDAHATAFAIFTVTNPRCDLPICAHGGTWDNTKKKCNCTGAYTSASNCSVTACDDPLTEDFVEGYNVTDPNNALRSICHCNLPFTSADPAIQQECRADICGANGVPNPALTALTAPKDYCICTGATYTTCPEGDKLVPCTYCQESVCLNNGKPNATNPKLCDCSGAFPYTLGNVCETSVCGQFSQPDKVGKKCNCLYGWGGNLCDVNPCINGAFSAVTKKCVCDGNYTTESFCKSLRDHSTTPLVLQALIQNQPLPGSAPIMNPPDTKSKCAVGTTCALGLGLGLGLGLPVVIGASYFFWNKKKPSVPSSNPYAPISGMDGPRY